MDTKNPPDFRWEGAKCELYHIFNEKKPLSALVIRP